MIKLNLNKWPVKSGWSRQTFTQDVDPHAEPALARSVPGDALVDAGVVHGDDLDDEGVKTLLTHQHLVVVVRTDGFAVQVPADVGRREASHLDSGRRGVGRGGGVKSSKCLQTDTGLKVTNTVPEGTNSPTRSRVSASRTWGETLFFCNDFKWHFDLQRF